MFVLCAFVCDGVGAAVVSFVVNEWLEAAQAFQVPLFVTAPAGTEDVRHQILFLS